jgi:hypothetical protein
LNAATERVIYLEQTHIETLMMVAEKESVDGSADRWVIAVIVTA